MWNETVQEKTKNASNELSQMPRVSQHWGLANMMMLLACFFASVKMRRLNGCEQELRGVFEYAHYTKMTLHKGGHFMEHREPPWDIHYMALYSFILDVLFYVRKITSIQNKRSPKTETMCIILFNRRFTATL
ncbi:MULTISPECIES: hypothetical protein [unclassified Bartonella]|uniref:hypothetical protein n=1 Tax=unclassified Bartonella TaxID=2645622 RepID=UPI0035D060DD